MEHDGGPARQGTGIGLAASLQFMATLPPTPLSLNPEEPMLEYDRSSHPFREDLIGGAIRMVEGKVAIPQAPGIGSRSTVTYSTETVANHTNYTPAIS